MLETMLVVTAIAMVVLVMVIRRHQNVEHGMWVKMVNMEFEIDRLRDLLRRSSVQMGCACEFHPEEHLEVERFKTVLDSLHVDTNAFSKP